MKSKTLIVLAVIAVLVIIGAMLLNGKPRVAKNSMVGRLLLPDLSESLNAANRINLTMSDGDKVVTIVLVDNGWIVLPQRYAADSGKIRQFLIRLADARIDEAKTANPDFYPRLGVEDVTTEAGSGALVEIAGPASPVGVIVGDLETRGGGGTYVRRSGDAQSYLVDSELDPSRASLDWLDRDLLDIQSKSVTQVIVTHADGETLRLDRIADWMILRDLPEGRELTSPTAVESMSTALSGLQLDDVVPADQFDGGDPEVETTYTIDDGRIVKLHVWKTDDGRFVTLGVSLQDAPEAVEEDADSDAAERAEDAIGEVEKPARAVAEAVARDNNRLQGWVFEIPSAKYELMVRRTEDLLKPLPTTE